jgi:hypothetical integral membrane protein (TIGR02206 family)
VSHRLQRVQQSARNAAGRHNGPELPDPATDRFVPFGPTHLTTLALVAALVIGLVRLVRARPRLDPAVRRGLFAAIVALVSVELVEAARYGWLGWKTILPLELCDAAMLLAVVSLLRPRPAPTELLYFWAGAGSPLAMLTPELPWTFPRYEYVFFFGVHALVLASALVLVFGTGLRPRPGAAWRASLAFLVWTAFVGLADAALGTNFMFLREKPSATTPLDWMGPWPVYIGVAQVVAAVFFQGLALPFRREWRAA